jgi:hypothetical protein
MGGFLQGVSAASSTDVWAVGYREKDSTEALVTVVMHWDGTSWTRVPSPNPGGEGLNAENVLTSVDGSSASAWAVGSFRVLGVTATLVLRWNGFRWTRVRSPSPGGDSNGSVSELNGVSGPTGSGTWGVGDAYNGSEGWVRSLILHWDGTRWTRVASPNPSGKEFPGVNRLFAVGADASSDAWAVGWLKSGSGENDTLILHWNGTRWSTS